MADLAQRVATRLRPGIEKKAWEPDEWYPTREQERRIQEEEGCLGPDGNGCPYENLSDDQEARLCERCEADIEATSLEEYVPWDELEECCPEVWQQLDQEYQALLQQGGGGTNPKNLENFPEFVDAAQKLREVLLDRYVKPAKQQ